MGTEFPEGLKTQTIEVHYSFGADHYRAFFYGELLVPSPRNKHTFSESLLAEIAKKAEAGSLLYIWNCWRDDFTENPDGTGPSG